MTSETGSNDKMHDYSDIIEEALSWSFVYGKFSPNVSETCTGVVPIGNLTIDYIGADSGGKPFYVFSFLYTIVQKIMCSLKLTITFVSHPDGFYKFRTLLLDPIPLDPEGTKYGDIVATEQVYMFEVMTTMREVDKGNYFSFFYLFEVEIWLCLVVSIGIMVILWNSTNSHQINMSTAVGYIMRSLTAQMIPKFGELYKNQSRNSEKRRKKSLFLSLFVTWLLLGAMIQRCISSVLLNSYLKNAPEPLFSDTKQIYYDKNIKIAGSLYYLPDTYMIQKAKKSRFLDDKKYPVSAEVPEFLNTAKLVKEKEAVIFDHTYGMQQKIRLLQEIDNLVVLERKYAPTYITFFVNKKVKYKDLILKLILTGIEAGLYSRYRVVEDIKIDVRRIIYKKFYTKKYNELISNEQEKFALELKEIWGSVILILVIGCYISLLSLVFELIYHRFFEERIENKIKSITLNQPASSFWYKLLNNGNKFLKKAKRLRGLTFEEKQVHRKLRSNFRLYFEK